MGAGRSRDRGPEVPNVRDGRSIPDPVSFTPGFSFRGRRLCCEGVAVEKLAARAGTPLYVYTKAGLTSSVRRLSRALGSAGLARHTLCYSVKANSNLSLLRLLAGQGCSFDIVSGGELFRLRQIGVPGRRIVFSGVGKSREEIREALDARILLFNVESESEIELLASEAARPPRPEGSGFGAGPAAAAIRVNPDVQAGGHPHISTGRHQHKFGLDWPAARRAYRTHRHSRWVRWQGISAHIGSQILSVAPFRRAVRRLAGYVRVLARDGIQLRYFDFGGGLGIRYANESPVSLSAYAQSIAAAVRPLGCHLLLEPGRSIVGPAGVLLTRVLNVKRTGGKTFVVVDAAMNDFLRPALYGALHPITPAMRQRGRGSARADVVGPVCETGDCFVQDWPLGEVEPGEVLVIWGAGAYGFVAASNYNSRPRPAEVLVSGSRYRFIRRRESRHDLIRGE